MITTHIRRGEAVEELSPLKAAANETAGDDQPRADFPQLTASLRDMVDLLDTMTRRDQA